MRNFKKEGWVKCEVKKSYKKMGLITGAAVYMIVLKSTRRKIVYVGSSRYLFRRIANHVVIGRIKKNIPNSQIEVWYKDFDNDGHSDGAMKVKCSRSPGYKIASELISLFDDCDDDIETVYPGAPELCNGMDDNCDGFVDNGAPSGQTYTGSLTLTSQTAVDEVPSCYSVINGDLTIKGGTVESLANLANLEIVTGNLDIRLTSLSDLTGLDGLVEVGGSVFICWSWVIWC